MAKKIFIIGAGGFIGGCLLEKFSQDASEDVVGYSSRECNLLSLNSIHIALSSLTKDDVLVVASSISRLRENSYDSMIANIQMAENLGHFLETHPVSQVIFFSTVDVYGLLSDDVLIREELLPNPNDYYAISKLASEYLLKNKLSSHGIALCIFRLTGVYGPGDEGKSTINALVKSALTKGLITVYGDGSNKRDFVYVDDVFKITLEAIRCKANITVNMATGKSTSIKEIAEMIIEVLGDEVAVKFSSPKTSAENRIKHMVYNIDRLQTFFPEMNFTTIKDGINLYLTYQK